MILYDVNAGLMLIQLFGTTILINVLIQTLLPGEFFLT